jgi:hypothetical protein
MLPNWWILVAFSCAGYLVVGDGRFRVAHLPLSGIPETTGGRGRRPEQPQGWTKTVAERVPSGERASTPAPGGASPGGGDEGERNCWRRAAAFPSAFFRFNPACGGAPPPGETPRREQARRPLSGHGAAVGTEIDGEIADSWADPVGCCQDAEGAQARQADERARADCRQTDR